MSETHMEQKIDLDALEAALAKATPGKIYLIENGGAGLDPDPNYWEIYKGSGSCLDGSDGFAITGFICEGDARLIAMAHNSLPALIAELRELRARVTPEPIGEKHRDGNWWLIWEPGYEAWYKLRWRDNSWQGSGFRFFGTPTHALPAPPAPEAQ